MKMAPIFIVNDFSTILNLSNKCYSRTLTSQKTCVIWLTENPLKMMKNAFYLILKALFVLKISKFF